MDADCLSDSGQAAPAARNAVRHLRPQRGTTHRTPADRRIRGGDRRNPRPFDACQSRDRRRAGIIAVGNPRFRPRQGGEPRPHQSEGGGFAQPLPHAGDRARAGGRVARGTAVSLNRPPQAVPQIGYCRRARRGPGDLCFPFLVETVAFCCTSSGVATGARPIADDEIAGTQPLCRGLAICRHIDDDDPLCRFGRENCLRRSLGQLGELEPERVDAWAAVSAFPVQAAVAADDSGRGLRP